MFNILYWVLMIGVVVYFLYEIFLSKQARSTRELAKMNIFWEEFNDSFKDKEGLKDLRNRVMAGKWRYHREKAELLLKMINARK